jgi:glycosyltransferase involved in cell wall biosynthesis
VAELIQSQKHNDLPPFVTVAMPIYNPGKHLRLAVLSIVKQTFSNWEFLIIDDGSTDNALQDIMDIKDARIRIICDGVNRGLAARLNELIDLARGQYLARMDQDDVSYPERFARQIEALQNDSRLDLVATRTITINESNEATGLFPYSISHDNICARPWRGFYFTHPTWMGRIEWFRRHRYSVPGPYFCEDQELLLRSYRDSKFDTIDEVLFAYRVQANVDQRKLVNTRWAVLKLQLRYFTKLNMWHFVLLAAVSFVAKVGNDLLKRMGRCTYPSSRDIQYETVAHKWNRIIDSYETESKAS